MLLTVLLVLSGHPIVSYCQRHCCYTVLHLHDPLVCNAGMQNVQWTCRICETSKYLEKVALPYVFRFLSTELAAMNIKCTLSVS